MIMENASFSCVMLKTSKKPEIVENLEGFVLFQTNNGCAEGCLLRLQILEQHESLTKTDTVQMAPESE